MRPHAGDPPPPAAREEGRDASATGLVSMHLARVSTDLGCGKNGATAVWAALVGGATSIPSPT